MKQILADESVDFRIVIAFRSNDFLFPTNNLTTTAAIGGQCYH